MEEFGGFEHFSSQPVATEVCATDTNLKLSPQYVIEDLSYPVYENIPKHTNTPYSKHDKFGSYKAMEWTVENILHLLHTTNDGRYILSDSVKNNGILSDDSRNLLTQLLINHLLQDQCRGTDFFFRKISDIIVEVFPKEQKFVYFIPPKTEGSHQSHAKGKLIERWKNVARKLRSVGAISCDRMKPLESQNSTLLPLYFSEEVQAAKNWLISGGLNFKFCDKDKWKITFDIRKNDIFKLNSLADIFIAWPPFQGPNGYELIIEDFKIGYPETHAVNENLKDSWEQFSNRLIEIRKLSIKDKHAKELLKELDSSELNGDLRSSSVIKLLLVPYLVPTKTQIKINSLNAKNKFWKPSLFESTLAFATHVTNITTFNEEFTKRQQRYCQFGTTIQPYIVFVGPDIHTIQSIYVRLDQKFWCFECPIKALEVCFKSYFVLHRSYPKECLDSWLVIQLLLFKLKTVHDKPTSISTAITGIF